MSDRGQSTLDFLLGTVIFLLAMILVVTFVPGMLDPFATRSTSHPVVADRAVSTLSADELSTGDRPYVTTETRVNAVVADQSHAQLRAELGLPERVSCNVTLARWQSGPAPPSTASVTAAQRVVSIDGEPTTVTVRVW